MSPVLFFDLHGVIVNTPRLFDEYRKLTINHLVNDFDLNPKNAAKRYDKALQKWENKAFSYLKNPETSKEGDTLVDNLDIYDNYFSTTLYQGLIKKNKIEIRKKPFEYLISKHITTLYPEVQSTLEILSDNNYEMYIASSSNTSHIRGIIEANNLDQYFIDYFGYNSVKATKYTTKYYSEIMKAAKSRPEYSFMIGNSAQEIIYPNKLGMNTVHINRERRIYDSHRNEANFSIDNLDTLPYILDSYQFQ